MLVCVIWLWVMDLSWLSHSLIEKEPTWQATEQTLLLENEHILPGIFMKNFVTYKQVTELLPDPGEHC